MKGLGNYFWGFFLIGVGALFIAKYYFRISISTVRLVGGVFFIALGLAWLLGGFQVESENNMFFGEGTIYPGEVQDDYNIVFSNGVVDLTNLSLEDGKSQVKIKINVVFGKGIIKINPDIPTVINANAAFGKVETSDGSSIVMGDHSYRIYKDDEDKILYIDATAVFGQLKIIEIKGSSS